MCHCLFYAYLLIARFRCYTPAHARTPGETYEAEHYGRDHWHLRVDVDLLLERQRMATQKKVRKRLESDLPNEFFHVNRFRRWWVNLHVIATFWRLLSGFQSVSVSLKIIGVLTKVREAAALRPATIAAAQGDKEEPGTSNALQAVRNVMSMFNLITGTVVGSDGYRVQCRHAGQAYTILWGLLLFSQLRTWQTPETLLCFLSKVSRLI